MKIINKFIYLIKLILHNKKYFVQNFKESENIILVEKYNYLPSLLSFAYFLNVLSKKYEAKIYSYNPRIISFREQIKLSLNPKNLIIKLIFRSFNVKKNINPKINDSQKKISDRYFKKVYSKIKRKEDVLKIKIFNIHIGDLIYDEYLRHYKEPTINHSLKKFKDHLYKMISLFIYWSDYINNNNVKSIVISHSVYAIAIISRIAIKKNIKVFNIGLSYAYCLGKNNKLRLSGFEKYKKNFKLISKILKKDLKKIAKKELNNKLYGKKVQSFSIANNANYSAFKKIKIKKNDNLNEKILVASHCLTDAVHAYGNYKFPDFYSWMKYLGNISEKKNFEWLIKVHPSQYDLNLKEMKNFIRKFPKFKLLDKNISHNEILNSYKILGVLSVYGSIGHEYPLFGVPVINSSTNNPHASYSFNINAKSKKELKDIITNIKKIKKPSSQKLKNEIYEYYYMRYLSEYYCIKDLESVVNDLRGDYNSLLFYKWWILNFNINQHNKILRDYKNFIESGKFRMHADNTKNKSIYLDI